MERVGAVFGNQGCPVGDGVFAKGRDAVTRLVMDEWAGIGGGGESVADGCRCEARGEGVEKGAVDGLLNEDTICGDADLS